MRSERVTLRVSIFYLSSVHRWLLIVLFPALLFAQASEERIEDSGVSGDGEACLPDDSLYQGNLPSLEPGAPVLGSIGASRLRLSNSFAVTRSGTKQVNWTDVWSRLRLTVQDRPDFRTDLLIVRRVNDPQTIDELHLTVSGTHSQTEIEYTFGTYQVDWGMGLLTSAAYGTAREFSYSSTFVPRIGQGVIARPTSREGSWLRGAVIERQILRLSLIALGSLRPWNAEIENDQARLTGVIQPSSSIGLDQRDQIDEQLFGVGAKFISERVEFSALGQYSNYSTELQSVGSELRQFTSLGSFSTNHFAARAEFARSGAESAWQSLISGMTGSWQGTAYARYAGPDYFALRSQSPESFGEPVANESTLGVRAGFASGRHRFTGNVSDLSTPASTPTVGPSRQRTEAELNWTFDFTQAGALSVRFASGSREERNAGEIVDRDYQRVKLNFSLQRGVLWSVRIEDRRSRDVTGRNPANGSYQHFQASLPDGKIRLGARVAFFSIDSADGPLLVYEPSVSGAYPLSSVSGKGRHMAAWLSVSVKNWTTRLKASMTEKVSDASPDTNYGFDLSFRY